MRLHEITDTPGDYLLTEFHIDKVIDELLRSAGNILLSAAGCSRRQRAVSRGATCCPTSARLLPDWMPDLKAAIL